MRRGRGEAVRHSEPLRSAPFRHVAAPVDGVLKTLEKIKTLIKSGIRNRNVFEFETFPEFRLEVSDACVLLLPRQTKVALSVDRHPRFPGVRVSKGSMRR